MAQILVGQLDDFERGELLATELRALGIGNNDIQQFALNAPGQHDLFPIGGDEDADRVARGGEGGALAGAAIGGVAGVALGVAAMPVAGPIAGVAGLAIGAYTGSLAGALNKMGHKADQVGDQIIARPAGVRIAVHITAPEHEARVADAMVRHHARSIEEAEGTWRDGTWADFDPASVPRWKVPPPQ